MFFDSAAKRLLRIRSDEFSSWLSEWIRINRADSIFKYVMAEVETAALSSQQTTGILPESFWTSRQGAIYLSCGDGTAARITAGGVALVDNGAEDNFWPCCDAGGILTLDNADSKCRWLADALASAATDGCSQRRKLYTNTETVILRAKAWLCITSANPTFASDSGLADRLLLVRMESATENTSDSALTDEILAARDSGLSHIATTLSAALADKVPVPPGLNKRHPDFATFACRIGRALGRESEALAALQTAEADKSAFCLENDAVATALLAYLRTTATFEGTAAELARRLIETDSELEGRLSAKRLGKRLVALWPHLQSVLKIAKRETDRKGFLRFTFKSADFADFQTVIS